MPFSSSKRASLVTCGGMAALLAFAAGGLAQNPSAGRGRAPRGRPQDTEVWEPVPPVVTPGAVDAAPPSDAIVLFDGKNLDEWVNTRDKSPANWTVRDGAMTVYKGRGAGNIETKRKFRNYQLHLEWKIPANVTGTDQARGNSGVFLASTGGGDSGYELQILDSYQNKTYVNGQAGSIYKQGSPLANPARQPGEWQTYDVIWMAPVFRADGSLQTPAYATVFFNGVLVHHRQEILGTMVHRQLARYTPHDTEEPLSLQDHGHEVRYRNVWIRRLRGYDQPER